MFIKDSEFKGLGLIGFMVSGLGRRRPRCLRFRVWGLGFIGFLGFIGLTGLIGIIGFLGVIGF